MTLPGTNKTSYIVKEMYVPCITSSNVNVTDTASPGPGDGGSAEHGSEAAGDERPAAGRETGQV